MQAVLEPESHLQPEKNLEVAALAAPARPQPELEPSRQALIDRVRAEIRAGRYLTDDKLDVAVDRLVRHARSEIAREARRLWLAGISQPKECDSVFSRLREAGQLTDDLVLQRLDLALEAEQFGLAAYLARQLDDAQRQRVKRWQRMRDRPETELATPKPLRGADRDPALVV